MIDASDGFTVAVKYPSGWVAREREGQPFKPSEAPPEANKVPWPTL